jgi:uncharacterized protein (TIGR00290 family)
MAMKIALSWSGGRDSMMMLHTLKDKCEPVVLITTFDEVTKKVMMHHIPFELMEAQAKRLRLELFPIWLRPPYDNDTYERTMKDALEQLKERGITHVAFGDLFLEDIRSYREQQMARMGLTPIFPLWGKETKSLAAEFIGLGYQAKVICVDSDQLSPEFLGREYDTSFIHELPDEVDPCGENGEFHSFVFDGPLFQEAVPFSTRGSYVTYDRFYYCELKMRKK